MPITSILLDISIFFIFHMACVRVHTCMFVLAHWHLCSWRSEVMPGVFITSHLTLWSRDSHPNPELADWAGLASQLVPGILFLCLPPEAENTGRPLHLLGIYVSSSVIHNDSEYWGSKLQSLPLCSTLPNSPSPNPLFLIVL